MRSARPKVLHRLAGRRLLQHVLDAAAGAGGDAHASSSPATAPTRSSGASRAPGLRVRAPGAAARHRPRACSRPRRCCDDDGTTLVLNGDVPLIESRDARARWSPPARRQRLALLTVELADPSGYGRIVRAQRRTRTARSSGDRRGEGRDRRAARDPRDLHRHHGRADARC